MIQPQGILDYFLRWESEMPNNIFLQQPSAQDWNNLSWQAVGAEARKTLNGLRALGLQKGDRVAILSLNCAQWIICDLAIMMGGFISVPLYANVNAGTMTNILDHSGTKVMFIGKLLPKDWDNIKDFIPKKVNCITMQGYARESYTSWEKFNAQQSANAEINKPAVDDILTLIYTSGTTGASKGVVHTNGSILNALLVASEEVLFQFPGNRFFSYLPLSHAAERGLVEFGAIFCGGSIGFVHSLETFSTNIQHVKPTHFLGVPRIWEKFQTKILETLPQSRLNLLLSIPFINQWLRKKIKKTLGLDRATVVLTGAAPIAKDLLLWFQRLGIRIREAYGMSENFNVCSINPQNDIRPGSVGKLFPNQEVRIDPETSEIIQKSSWQMKGYYRDELLTNATIKDGFLHTGDMGWISPDGFLTISGRVKDIFKTHKGEYIAPAPIEKNFAALPAVDQVCVMGSMYAQPFLVLGLSETGKRESTEQIKEELSQAIKQYNAGCMEYQRLKIAIIVSEEWSPDNGLLTPSLKMKRDALSKKYEKKLESIYHSGEIVAWES